MEFLCQPFVSQESLHRQFRLGCAESSAGLSLAQNTGQGDPFRIDRPALLIVVHRRSALLVHAPYDRGHR